MTRMSDGSLDGFMAIILRMVVAKHYAQIQERSVNGIIV
jgi:hypothetical protein